ncbi:hypothetical protein CYLTODRAFT_422908 [Cylindrobasidium torrendii FP15055 ss-10]|uniref:Transmembrane protein n=1 Tax=Cylindrobasidium torrendii FP15055 ss-10 TaxID=1314674 RepID=A0A0D7B8X6_9AGAR|nr:hypothetical protein CYLTODRAFT_422908 [Cylindrobasidium torrendii FP15055 ss-10]
MFSSRISFRAMVDRITLNKVTTAFFLFGFFHCIAQGVIQSILLRHDAIHSTFLDRIVHTAGVPPANHTFLASNTVKVCDSIPHELDKCWDAYTLGSSVHSDNVINGLAVPPPREISMFPTNVDSDPVGIRLRDGKEVALTKQCVATLLLPAEEMANNRREDVTFLLIQFWLFGMAVFAMVRDSVPHLIASICARVLLVAWSSYVIWRTKYTEMMYAQLLRAEGTPCSIEFFPEYFGTRTMLEIPDLVLNCTSLAIAIWTVLRVYSRQSYQCVGAPSHILRMQKLNMAVQACLHLEVYVLLTAMGLWVDQLFGTYIKYSSKHTKLYVAVIILYSVLVLPWTVLGWYAIRQENRRALYTFLFVGFLFFFTASMMFYSEVFRWAFLSWPNLGCYTVAYMVLTAACVVLAVCCLRNFGQGLKEYLHAVSNLASMNFSPEVFTHGDVEKAKLPQPEVPLPLYLEKAGPVAVDNGNRPPSTFFVPTLHIRQESGAELVVGIKSGRR